MHDYAALAKIEDERHAQDQMTLGRDHVMTLLLSKTSGWVNSTARLDRVLDLMRRLIEILWFLIDEAKDGDRHRFARKWRFDVFTGALGRISRLVQRSAMKEYAAEIKTILASDESWRARVLEDLGGETALKAWEVKAKHNTEICHSGAALQTPEHRDSQVTRQVTPPRNESDTDECKYVPRIPTDRDGIFRLAPVPRPLAVASKRNPANRLVDLCHDTEQEPFARNFKTTGGLKLDNIFPIPLTPDDLRGLSDSDIKGPDSLFPDSPFYEDIWRWIPERKNQAFKPRATYEQTTDPDITWDRLTTARGRADMIDGLNRLAFKANTDAKDLRHADLPPYQCPRPYFECPV